MYHPLDFSKPFHHQTSTTIKCPLFQILKSTLVLFKPLLGFPGGSVVKNPPVNAGDSGDKGLTPGLGRSPGGGNSTPQTATHSSMLAWGVLWTEDPGGLQSMGSHRVGHDWSDLTLAYSILAWKIPWTEESTDHGVTKNWTWLSPRAHTQATVTLIQQLNQMFANRIMSMECSLFQLWLLSL